MPLIILTGYPSSGKTKRAEELKEFFINQGKEVHIVSELEEVTKAGLDRNTYFNDARKEKDIRAALKSAMQKLISPKNVIIMDGANYIKGYRYELFCATKANHSTQCTVQTVINKDVAWEFNEKRDESEKYDKNTFDGLLMRYEEPHGNNRWDAPLYYVMNDNSLDFNAISNSLFEKAPPPPNMSTQNAPLSSTNFLYEMNKVVKDITTALMKMIKDGKYGDVDIPGYEDLEIDITNATIPKLVQLSRQYLTYSKMHKPDINQVPQLYVQYLRTNLQ